MKYKIKMPSSTTLPQIGEYFCYSLEEHSVIYMRISDADGQKIFKGIVADAELSKMLFSVEAGTCYFNYGDRNAAITILEIVGAEPNGRVIFAPKERNLI
jgi:hypothetical protein